jgi:N-sulfoglucosamine sulfohydrolase
MQHCGYPDHLATWQELRRLHSEEGNQLARGEARDRLTPLQRSVVAACKPPEELYDLAADPYETVNLAEDPEYREVLDRLRAALDGWLEEYGDLGQLPEDELIEQWRPGGRCRPTEAPVVVVRDGLLEVTCSTPGASIGWTTDAPAPPAPQSPLAAASGMPEADGRYWRLYAGPVQAPSAGTVWLRAWRLGHEPSVDVPVRID